MMISGRVARLLRAGGTAARDGWHGGAGRVARRLGSGGTGGSGESTKCLCFLFDVYFETVRRRDACTFNFLRKLYLVCFVSFGLIKCFLCSAVGAQASPSASGQQQMMH